MRRSRQSPRNVYALSAWSSAISLAEFKICPSWLVKRNEHALGKLPCSERSPWIIYQDHTLVIAPAVLSTAADCCGLDDRLGDGVAIDSQHDPTLRNESNGSNFVHTEVRGIRSTPTHFGLRLEAFGYSGNTNWGSVSSVTAISLTFALVTRITESTTTALPDTMNPFTRSCRTNHPRKTATTGFTYA